MCEQLNQLPKCEQARLGLPATREPAVFMSANGRPPAGLETAIAMNTTREMLSGLTCPRWSGSGLKHPKRCGRTWHRCALPPRAAAARGCTLHRIIIR